MRDPNSINVSRAWGPTGGLMGPASVFGCGENFGGGGIDFG